MDNGRKGFFGTVEPYREKGYAIREKKIESKMTLLILPIEDISGATISATIGLKCHIFQAIEVKICHDQISKIVVNHFFFCILSRGIRSYVAAMTPIRGPKQPGCQDNLLRGHSCFVRNGNLHY